ncbi:titin [Cephus cinctus]|uniref:Titin n=1 Tax=Cephus cinctus TaxID=211228 RepID=A0AAJ7FT76_CEPCN|nr:titin [Cephus cinctus]
MGNAPTKTSSYNKSQPLTTTGNSKRVHWDGPGLPSAPGKPILVPGTEDTQPDVVSIRWERSPSNGGSAIIGYLVEHRRMGSPHWVRSAPILCTFPELTLSGLEPGWRYQFRVRAQNALGLSEPSELSDPLTVTLQRAAASTPHFELELKDTTVLENEQAEFIVHFAGTPLPKISWFKDGFEIFSSRRTRIFTENGKSTLLIHQTALNDEGEIKCTATNRVGHISTRARLILEAPPRIRLPRQYEDGLLFEQNETIRLKVSLAGRPTPVINWYHDGELVPNDDRHIVESMDGECVLKIPDAKRKDRGEYTVKAINKLAEDVASFLVTVTDRPSAPGKAIVTMTLGRSVTLSWKEPDDDGGCKIGTYIVEYYRVGWDVWLKAATCRQLTTTLGELIEGSEYRFRVKAENPYGVSDSSEESDVVFIPDPKRGITAPPLRGKSQSQHEINKAREKREVSFAEPVQRTRSLTREEASRGVPETPSEWSSTQRLSTGRLSRADRVTFADMIDTKPELPARSRKLSKQDRSEPGVTLERDTEVTDTFEKKETLTLTKQSTLEPGRRSPFRETRSRSVSRERSLSPLPMPKIQESQEENSLLRPNAPHFLLQKQNTIDSLPVDRPALHIGLKRQNTVDSIPTSPSVPREDDETMLHGSSEFMLVLYPEEGDQTQNQKATSHIERTQSATETEDEDLVPPPMSLSLPELFSINHEVVETLREAVSSTELLHERAMERFYHAVAVEEAELAKRKAQTERRTGELAGITGPSQKSDVKIRINSMEAVDSDSLERRVSLRRRLSNSGVGIQMAWQAKKERRRSSEGQAELQITSKSQPVLQDIASDPNLTGNRENLMSKIESSQNHIERLHRWDEKSMPLTVEKLELTTEVPEDNVEEEVPKEEVEEEEEEESTESSEESSEEESSDSEDLKLLKSRILAQPIIDEEDTYHPRGNPVPHMSPEPPPIPAHKVPILNISPPVPSRPVSLPSSPTNVMPKSILKKRTETEVVPLNQFGRPIPPEKPLPPEKPIRKTLQQEEQPEAEPVTLRKKSLTNMPDTMKATVISEADIENANMFSAAEAARNRRRQIRQTSLEEEAEANMAVINHYTEIVKEYSVAHSAHPVYLKREELINAAPKEEIEPVEFRPRKNSINAAEYTERNRRPSVSGKDLNENARRPSISDNAAREKTMSPERKQMSKKTKSPTPKREVKENKVTQNRRGSVSKVNKDQKEDQPKSRRNSVSSRGTTPAKEIKDRPSRPPSRTESPGPRSRNVSKERRPSRPSSRTEDRAVSQERGLPQRSRPPSRTASEDIRSTRDKSVDKRKSSRPSSRSNSRDRYRPETPTGTRMERLQQALDSKKYRSRKKLTDREYSDSVDELTARAEIKVRSTMSYVTDLSLLLAAVYVYIFKNEILAVPFIGLLLYRQIQEEIHRRLPSWWIRRHQ